MKKLPTTLESRNRERGTVALIIAVMWTALFGMAVMAVDFGYLYTKKRGVQSAVDSALKAAMPVYKNSGYSLASDRARLVAELSGYKDGVRDTTIIYAQSAGNTRFHVTIEREHPTFFGGIFGLRPRKVSATAIGELTAATGGPAIFSTDTTACGTQWDNAKGINFVGGGLLKINGNVESLNKIHIGNPSGTCDGVLCAITGTVTLPGACTFWNDAGPGVMGAPLPMAGAPADPLAAAIPLLNAACTPPGSLAVPFGVSFPGGVPFGPEVAGCNPIVTGVYCAIDGINVTPPGPGQSICPSTASFFSATGQIGINANGSISLAPAPTAPSRIIAYSGMPLGGPAIQIANGPATLYTINGSIYAPVGLVNVNTGTPGFNMTGILAGQVVNVAMGPGQPWTFNAPTGGSGSGWKLYQ